MVTFNQELPYFDGPNYGVTRPELGSVYKESNLQKEIKGGTSARAAQFCYAQISSWKVFHFHDTSDTAAVKRKGVLHDDENLRSDAGNLTA